MEILRVENLSKIYGKGQTQVKAIDNVSFKVEKRRICSNSGSITEVESQLYYI